MSEIQVPPQDLQMERALLGLLLISGAKQPDAIRTIQPTQFYNEFHATIFAAIHGLYDRLGAADAMSTAEELNRIGKLSEVGGLYYLLELMEQHYNWSLASYYAEVIIDCWRRRKCISQCEDVVRRSYDRTLPLADTVEKFDLETAISLKRRRGGRPTLITVEQASREAAEAAKAVDNIQTIWKGIDRIDEQTQGCGRGEMIIVAARPSHGKSLGAMQWLDCFAEGGETGMIVSEEMSKLALGRRANLYLSEIPEDQWRMNSEGLICDINAHYKDRSSVWIAEACGTTDMAERMIDQAVERKGVSIVAVDYAQLLKGNGPNRYEQVTDTSNRLKQCAVRNNIVLLLLCQLSREIEKRPDRMPKLSDLRDSGQLEQDADIVIFLQWLWKDDPGHADKTEYNVYFAKNRNRGIRDGMITMSIKPERQRLEDGYDPSAGF